MSTTPLVEMRRLRLDLETEAGTAHILRDVDLTVPRGATVGVVGESGSGKSMMLRCLLGVAPARSTITGSIGFDGEDLLALTAERRRKLIGSRVGVVFQNPMTSLNPVVPVARQMGEAVRFHQGFSKQKARALSIDLLGQVGIVNPERRIDDYPHQFSGGMRQRVMIAMALTGEPELLIADEATTALDVTVQKSILDLLQRLQGERSMSLVLVSHNLGVVAGRADEVTVMYGGRVVESGPARQIFENAAHPYTQALLRAIPRLDAVPKQPLPAMRGLPPSVYDPTLPPDEADRRDLERWMSDQREDDDDN